MSRPFKVGDKVHVVRTLTCERHTGKAPLETDYIVKSIETVPSELHCNECNAVIASTPWTKLRLVVADGRSSYPVGRWAGRCEHVGKASDRRLLI